MAFQYESLQRSDQKPSDHFERSAGLILLVRVFTFSCRS